MANINKFEKMIEQNSQKRAVSSDAKFQKEAIKQNEKRRKIRLQEFKRNEPENYKKAVILSKKYGTRIEDYIGVDLSFVDNKGNILEGNNQDLTHFEHNNEPLNFEETPKNVVSMPEEKENQTSSKTQKIDLPELKSVQEEIRQEQGLSQETKASLQESNKENHSSSKVEKIDLSELKSMQDQIRKEQGFDDKPDTTYKLPKKEEQENIEEKKTFSEDVSISQENSLVSDILKQAVSENREQNSENQEKPENTINSSEKENLVLQKDNDNIESSLSEKTEDLKEDVKSNDLKEENVSSSENPDNENDSIKESVKEESKQAETVSSNGANNQIYINIEIPAGLTQIDSSAIQNSSTEKKEKKEEQTNFESQKSNKPDNENSEAEKSTNQNPEIEKKLNSHVSKIDHSEIEKAMNEIKNPSEESNQIEKSEAGQDGQTPKKAKKNIIFGMSNNSLKETIYEDLSEINAGKTVTEDSVQPEEIPSEFEGWSKEDIATELERRRRLADLKQKYSDDQGKNPNDIGEYKKSLDFSINQDIKRFRMKPPKKAIIITLVLLFVMIVAGVVTSVAILKKPPEPAVLVQSKISQTITYQFVGETVDLRGIYIEEIYSDGTTKTILVNNSMISKKSENINDSLQIVSNNSYTFIEFLHNGKAQVLRINLSEKIISAITSVEVYQDGLTNGEVLKFDNILILASVKNSENVYIGTKRILAKDVKYFIEGVGELEKTNDGVVLNSLSSGEISLKISFEENGKSFEKTINIDIEWLVLK